MQPPKRRLAASARLCSELALLFTLFFHLILFHCFSVADVGNTEIVARPEPECVFVSPPGQGTDWEETLRAWCFLSDPTIMSLPSSTHGFGRIRRGERIIPIAAIPQYSQTSRKIEEIPFEPAPAVEPMLPLNREVGDKWRIGLPPPLPGQPVAALPKNIIWRSPDGKALNDPPLLSRELLADALAVGKMPKASLRVEIDRTGQFTRLIVLQQSGNVQLDRVARDALRKEIFRFETVKTLDTGKDQIDYFPPRGSSKVIEVEWRLWAMSESEKGSANERSQIP